MTTAGPRDLSLRAVVRSAWEHLPVLLVGSGAVSLAVVVAVLALPISVWVTAVVVVAAVGPTMQALVTCAGRVVDEGWHEHVGVADLRRAWLAGWPAGARAVAVPTALTISTTLAAHAHRQGGEAWLLIPLATGTTLGLLSAVTALALLAQGGRLLASGRRPPTALVAWAGAVRTLVRAPLGFVAAACLLGLGSWLTVAVSPALVLVVPAPVAFVIVAARRSVPTYA